MLVAGVAAVVITVICSHLIMSVFENPEARGLAFGVSLFTLFCLLYIGPSILAFRMGHPHVAGIFLLNLVLGWTLIGWAAALAWTYFWKTPDKP